MKVSEKLRNRKYRLEIAILLTVVLGFCMGPNEGTLEKNNTGLITAKKIQVERYESEKTKSGGSTELEKGSAANYKDCEERREADCEISQEAGILAWWGNIYPEFCFMGERNTQGRPRIRFWLVENLKKYL